MDMDTFISHLDFSMDMDMVTIIIIDGMLILTILDTATMGTGYKYHETLTLDSNIFLSAIIIPGLTIIDVFMDTGSSKQDMCMGDIHTTVTIFKPQKN